jgi:hypothetical protein
MKQPILEGAAWSNRASCVADLDFTTGVAFVGAVKSALLYTQTCSYYDATEMSFLKSI